MATNFTFRLTQPNLFMFKDTCFSRNTCEEEMPRRTNVGDGGFSSPKFYGRLSTPLLFIWKIRSHSPPLLNCESHGTLASRRRVRSSEEHSPFKAFPAGARLHHTSYQSSFLRFCTCSLDKWNERKGMMQVRRG